MKNVLEISLARMYHLHVIVAYGIPIIDVFKHCKSRGCDLSPSWMKEAIEHADGANGFCCNLGPNNTDVLIWLKNPLHQGNKASEYGVLFHELFHAVDKITKTHNLHGEEECRAYLYEHLAEECCRHFWSIKEPKKKKHERKIKRRPSK